MHVFLIIQTDSESPRKVSSGVLLPAADRHGACSQGVSGEHDNGNFLLDSMLVCNLLQAAVNFISVCLGLLLDCGHALQ